jgi:hypothetical protein
MVAGHTIENDGKTWTPKVLPRDCVASIRL